MILLVLKPVSTNAMYESDSSGRKWKSAKYSDFEANAKRMLKHKPLSLPKTGDLKFTAVFGVSSRFDLDNSLKAFIDILEDVYGFDDKRITHIDVRKESVRRKEEFIQFNIEPV